MLAFLRFLLLSLILGQATLGLCPTGWAEGEDDPLWNRPSFEKKVINVGQRLLAANGITERIQFFSVSRDIRNASASRFGGPNTVLIYKDLLDVMESDDELAAVLAHEIAHITKRHTARTMPKKWAAKTALWTAYTVGGTAASLATGGLATPAVILGAAGIRKMHRQGIGFTDPIGRPYEKEADLVGLDYLVKAGYNPLAMETLMAKISGDAGPIANFFASHPGGTDRLTYIHEAIKTNYPQFLTAELADNPLPGSLYTLKTQEQTPASKLPLVAASTPSSAPVISAAVEIPPQAKADKTPTRASEPVDTKKKQSEPVTTEAAKVLEAPVVPAPVKLAYQPKKEALEKPPAKIQMALVSASSTRSEAGNGETQSSKALAEGESVAHVLLTLQPNHLRMLRMISQRGYLSRRELREQMEYVEEETLMVQVTELIRKRLVRLLGAEPDEVIVLTDWAAAAFQPASTSP